MILSIIALFLVLVSLPFFLAVRFGKRFEETIFLSCGTIILGLFGCGICGFLRAGIWLTLGTAGILLAFSAALLIRKPRKGALKPFLSPGFAAFCLVYLFLLYAHGRRLVYYYDEFTHWGDVVKEMVHLDDFATNPAAHSRFQSYVPGMALFQYLFQELGILFGSEFLDWRLFFSYHLLAFSALLPVFNVRRWKDFLPALVVFACIAVTPSFLDSEYEYLASIYIDSFVGVLTGAGFALLFLKKPARLMKAHVLMTCALLVLAKDAGLLFAAALGIGFFLREISLRRGRKAAMIAALLVLAAVGLPKILWEINMRIRHAEVRFRTPIDLRELLRVIARRENGYLSTVFFGGYHRWFTGTVPLEGLGEVTVSYPLLFLALGIALLSARKRWNAITPELSGQRTIAGWIMIAVTAVYAAGLPVIYMFRFSREAALSFASFDRYLGMAYTGLAMMACLVWAAWIQERPEWLKRGACAALVMVLILIAPGTLEEILNRESVENSRYRRARYASVVNPMRSLAAGENTRVWVIAQEQDGLDYWSIRYSLRPECDTDIAEGSWSLSAGGDALYAGDQWSSHISAERWRELLKDFDYVLIYRVNDSFLEDYGSLFEDPEGIANEQIYEVDHERDLLVRVP